MIAEPRIVIAESAEDFGRTAAQVVLESARSADSPLGMFSIALSGGNTPRALYGALASPPVAESVPWDRTQVFFSDERFVPADSPQSNFHTAEQALLSKVPIPERFIHRVPTEDIAPDEAAAIYEEGIRRVLAAGPGQMPIFDLILLGLGDDGHTASLFPDTEALGMEDALVVPNFVPRLDSWRITFTYPLINAAGRVVFLVSGPEKAGVVADVLRGADFPAARVRPTDGELVWVLDRDAAAELPQAGSSNT
jgi:6-phosphogluconolactonase